MLINKLFLTVLCCFFITGCSYITTRRDVHFKSYTLNIEEQSSLGTPMITSELTQYAGGSRKYDLAEEQDQWQSFEYPTEHPFKEQLIYNGRSENIITISYKLYKKKLSFPSSSQELSFDLGSSDIIEFKNYKIRVLNATNEYIRFMVLAD